LRLSNGNQLTQEKSLPRWKDGGFGAGIPCDAFSITLAPKRLVEWTDRTVILDRGGQE
jgi:hypothetical protein